MRTFSDNAGRVWTVSVNVDSLKRVKALLNLNLLEIVDGEGTVLERLVDDPILLCDCVYALVKPEADAKQVTDEDFGRSMAGDAIDLATTALLEDLVDFFRKARRTVLAKAIAKLKEMERLAVEMADRRLEKLDQAAMERLLSEPGVSSGSSPASSASTPAP